MKIIFKKSCLVLIAYFILTPLTILALDNYTLKIDGTVSSKTELQIATPNTSLSNGSLDLGVNNSSILECTVTSNSTNGYSIFISSASGGKLIHENYNTRIGSGYYLKYTIDMINSTLTPQENQHWGTDNGVFDPINDINLATAQEIKFLPDNGNIALTRSTLGAKFKLLLSTNPKDDLLDGSFSDTIIVILESN
jgi:hypothetical protein